VAERQAPTSLKVELHSQTEEEGRSRVHHPHITEIETSVDLLHNSFM